MKIIQFKRDQKTATTESTPNLTAGELYIYPQTNSQKIRIGTNESGSTTEYFEIKAKPSCLYKNDGQPASSVVINVTTSGQTLAVTKLMPDGSTVTSYPTITIPGTAEYAKKLVTSGSSGYSVGSNLVPVYFSGGIPQKCFKNVNMGANSSTRMLLTLNSNGFDDYNESIGSALNPIYYDKDVGFKVIDTKQWSNVVIPNGSSKLIGLFEGTYACRVSWPEGEISTVVLQIGTETTFSWVSTPYVYNGYCYYLICSKNTSTYSLMANKKALSSVSGTNIGATILEMRKIG